MPRIGNAPWRTGEVSSGLLNAIGLDNDGVETFVADHLPYLRQIGTAILVSIAGRTADDFVELPNCVASQIRLPRTLVTPLGDATCV